ncbi:MAG: M24 family metallopeptidase [Candidatus Solibacter usitatus]|nr:M24 family metallopeptidase [Candidatus Solibacter usitatus]
MNLAEIQEKLRAEKLDGWLFFDHHQRDPLAYRVLNLTPGSPVTRRWYYFIPAQAEPRGLVHRIEAGTLDSLPGEKTAYSSWKEQVDGLQRLLANSRRVAMQYSPRCAIPYVSMVDAGTVELVRGAGVDVASSAELIQHFEARWSADALESHLEAGRRVDRVRREAFAMIGEHTRDGGSVQEFAVQQFVRERFRRERLLTDHGPIVGVNANASNPHYEPSETVTQPIRSSDLVLLDMWAKLDQPGAVCAGKELRGFEVDDAAREFIQSHGYGPYFTHRTGHSIGQDVHGNGANMDNLETHDERRIVPWTCFSIEPGVYLKNFGIRSEVNVFVGEREARVTGEVQKELVVI